VQNSDAAKCVVLLAFDNPKKLVFHFLILAFLCMLKSVIQVVCVVSMSGLGEMLAVSFELLKAVQNG
jgi:hypothetical protein